jgi:hypothetical protein
MKPIKIALDAFPYEPQLHRVCDYGGLQIFSKLALPLFADVEGVFTPLAARSLNTSEDGKTIDIALREDLLWNNGEAVLAEHYAQAFRSICGDTSNRFQSLLSDLAGYPQCAQGETAALGVVALGPHHLQLRLRNRNHWFAWILCHLQLSPLHSDVNLVSGPYIILQQDSGRFLLGANPHYFQKSVNDVPILEYVNYQGHANRADSIADYYNDLIDVSCDTVMYYDDFAVHQGKSDFRLRWPPLGMFLALGSQFSEIPIAVRRSLNSMVDRKALSAGLCGVPRPIQGYLDLYEFGASPPPRNQITQEACEIVLSYEDFYPNKQVAQMLVQQLAAFGVKGVLQENRFGDWSNTSHLRLAVQANASFGPLNFYKSDILRGYFEGAELERIRKLYSLYMQVPNAIQSRRIAIEIEKTLHTSGLSVPLLAIPSAALIRPNLNPESVYTIGMPVQYASSKHLQRCSINL